MNLMYLCIYVYLLLKPFYVLKSGSMQPADFFLVLAFFLLIASKNSRKKVKKIVNENRHFLFFVILTFAINGIYFIWYLKTKFILSSLYFVFNFFAIILFSFVFKNEKNTKDVTNILKIDLLIQLVIFLIGKGRWYGFARYMGTFNDPNQFGYFVLMCYMFIYITTIKYKDYRGNVFFLVIALFLIIQCASTGMFTAMFIFLALQIVSILKNVGKFIKNNSMKIVICIFTVLPVLLIFYWNNTEFINNRISNLLIVDRVIEKFNRAEKNSSSNVSLVQERGYDRFIYYPQYVLYGSGEGEYTRFTKTYHQDEIHATFPSILFYYGIFPTLILLYWIYKKISNIKLNVLIPITAIFLESFTLLNQRQVMFWILILFVSFTEKRKICNDAY